MLLCAVCANKKQSPRKILYINKGSMHGFHRKPHICTTPNLPYQIIFAKWQVSRCIFGNRWLRFDNVCACVCVWSITITRYGLHGLTHVGDIIIDLWVAQLSKPVNRNYEDKIYRPVAWRNVLCGLPTTDEQRTARKRWLAYYCPYCHNINLASFIIHRSLLRKVLDSTDDMTS